MNRKYNLIYNYCHSRKKPWRPLRISRQCSPLLAAALLGSPPTCQLKSKYSDVMMIWQHWVLVVFLSCLIIHVYEKTGIPFKRLKIIDESAVCRTQVIKWKANYLAFERFFLLWIILNWMKCPTHTGPYRKLIMYIKDKISSPFLQQFMIRRGNNYKILWVRSWVRAAWGQTARDKTGRYFAKNGII